MIHHLLVIFLSGYSFISYSMDDPELISSAKNDIRRYVGLNNPYHVTQLLARFGKYLSQEEKDKHLHRCALWGRCRITPQLLALGANPKLQLLGCRCTNLPCTCEQESLLHIAASRGNLKEVEALLEHGAEPNALSQNLETPLMKACRTKALYFQRGARRWVGCYVAIIQKLLEYGANASLVNKTGNTALQIAQMEIANPQYRQAIVNCFTIQKIS